MKKYIPEILLKKYYAIRNKIIANRIGGYSIRAIYDGHFNVTYRGIPTLKCPFDYVNYQMIVSNIKPDLVIEIGTNVGGTTLYIANLMDAMGHGTIHSIDIENRVVDIVKKHPRIKLFSEGWKKYDKNLAKGFSKILIIDDASHIYEDTLETLKALSPLVSIGSYFIVEDGIVTRLGRDKQLHGGPLRAIKDFLISNDTFEIDRKYCDMFGKDTTFNTDGYLKRIK